MLYILNNEDKLMCIKVLLVLVKLHSSIDYVEFLVFLLGHC